MSENYTTKVNNSTEFSISEQQITNLDAVKDSENTYHILQENKPFIAKIIESNFNDKSYTVKVNNNTYTVAISNAIDQLIKKMGFAVGASKQVNEIKAPMPGLILDINVNVGDEIMEDDSLLILEAMKMENSILSPRNGVVKSIGVTQGDAVDKGALLIEFE